MAQQDDRQQPKQPAEDFHGRPTGPHGEGRKDTPPRTPEPRPEPTRRDDDSQPAPRREARDSEDDGHCYPMKPGERTPGAVLDEIPDGDGPRSDAGTNPLPDVYWSAYPDGRPDPER